MTKKKTYKEKLLDPRWQKKRLEILQRDGWMCKICGAEDQTLHVHHKKYIPLKDPWDIESDFLITLCSECHDVEDLLLNGFLQSLVGILKDKFVSTDIHDLICGFYALPVINNSTHTANVLSWAMSEPSVMKRLESEFCYRIQNYQTAGVAF